MPFGLPYDSGEMAEVLRQRGSLEAQIGQTQASVSDCDPGWLSLFITYSEWAGWSWLTSPWASDGWKCQECDVTLIMGQKELQIVLVGALQMNGAIMTQKEVFRR